MSSYDAVCAAGRRAIRGHVRKALAAAAAGVFAAAGGTVSAQQAAQPSSVASEAAPEAGLQEVVVTAQFREEKLQQTPISITAISGDALRERNIENTSQLAAVAPNVTIDTAESAFGPTVNPFIRGIGQGDFNYNFEPGVGIYIDDVYFGTVAGSLFNLMDLQRVEVLRGPQGTLEGKNSIGGAIRFISEKPKGDNSAYIEGTFGNYDRKTFRGMFDVAVIPDKLFLRVTAQANRESGFVRDFDYACAHPDLGASAGYPVNLAAPRLLSNQGLKQGDCQTGTEGGQNTSGARAALRWLPFDGLEVNWNADFTSDNSEAAPTVLLNTNAPVNPANPTGTPARAVFENLFLQTFGVQYDDRFVTGNKFSNYSTFCDNLRDICIPPVARVNQWGTSLVVDWDLASTVHVKSVTGYRGYSGEWSDDQDASPLPLDWVHQVVDHHQLSEELQFTGTIFGGKLDYATGVFYLDETNLNRGHININVLPGAPIPGISVPLAGGAAAVFPAAIDFSQDDPSHVKDKAVFLQSTYHVTDKLSATAGVRYTDEDKDYTFYHVAPPFINLDNVVGLANYVRWDWKAVFDYQWTPGFMTYASASTGFKGGGLNPRPFDDAQVIPFKPETMLNYEVGAKSEWFNHRLRLNGDVFFMQYKDIQQSSGTLDATGAPFVGPTNVGEEHIKGFELEVDLEPIDKLLFNAGIGYTDAQYTNLGNAIGCNAPGLVPDPILGVGGAPTGLFTNCVTNGPLLSDTPGGPKWLGNAGVQYKAALAGGGSITPRLDIEARSSFPRGNSNDYFPEDDIGGYALVNGRVTWASQDGAWSVAALGTNLLNREYFVNYFDTRNLGEFSRVGQPGRPREWAVQIRRQF